jgi:CubicO group peptidase (beta-lactamase class C family)
MKLVSAILILLLAFGVMPVLAQDASTYDDPAGRFSVPAPAGWADESTAEMGRFASPDGIKVSVLGVEAADVQAGDQAVLTALIPELAGTDAAQTSSQPASSGTWTVNVYVPSAERMVAMATQWVEGVTYALLFDIPGQDIFVANQGQIIGMLNGFSFGKRLDLTGIQPRAFTDEMKAELEAYIEDARERFHVPGASIAIVQNGEIAYMGGFGTTEPGAGQPVTPDTLFMIGSTTKSMTTMMMGTLVDEGVLDWNQPVTDILPSFALSDAAATAQIRVRDLVNMSSGVAQYTTVLYMDDVQPDELLKQLVEIPILAPRGKLYNYSNQMFATGGYISAIATGASMDKLYEGYTNLVQERVFNPIGMTATTLDFDTALANPNHAVPYTYNPVTKTYTAVPLDNEREVVAIAPVGAVWSNADDMARYLQTELSGGVAPDGRRVISEATLQTTQSPEITPAGPFDSYGMGWIIEQYNGLKLVWHAGNTVGFTSDLALLPSANLGVVILTDAGAADYFYKSVREYIFELVFGLDHTASEKYAEAQAVREQSAPNSPNPNTPINADTVKPFLGRYEHNVTVEMRGNEFWLVGAFLQAPLHPDPETGDYIGNYQNNPFQVRFGQADDQTILEIANLLAGEKLSLKKVG